MPLTFAANVPLAPLTTLELGGPARHLVVAADTATLVEALRWAQGCGLPVLVLGGGSNLVVGDAGFSGLVIRVASRGITFAAEGDHQLVQVAAGEPWDGVVAATVAHGLAGIECLSGIPGLAGATPIQNVGAYGQEVSDVIRSVQVLDRATLMVGELTRDECRFAYRDSVFKRQPDRWIVVGVSFALRARGAAPVVRYRELEQALAASGPAAATVADVRAAVLALRRTKSMVIDPTDANRRSVGSFFMNPILPTPDADRLIARWRREGIITAADAVPCFPGGDGRSKLSAAWLIEHAGFAKGFRRGAVGISSRHALALVHHGGGTTADLLALADQIREAVDHRLGIRLAREPVVL